MKGWEGDGRSTLETLCLVNTGPHHLGRLPFPYYKGGHADEGWPSVICHLQSTRYVYAILHYSKEGYIIKSKNERLRLWRSNIGQFNRCKEADYDKAISSKQFDDCTNAVIRILPRIDLSGINKLIDSVEHLSQMQKEFIKESWNLGKKFCWWFI